jgi:hypothetical protein
MEANQMGNAISLAATFTPILLGIMGLVVTIWPPSRAIVKLGWVGAFIVIGIIAVFAELYDRSNQEKEIITNITGGNSFPHVDVAFTARNAITFVLRHSGTHTIPAATVQDSADVSKLIEEAKSGNKALSEDALVIMKRARQTIFSGTVNPGSSIFLSPTVSYMGERRDFLVFIAASNGIYREAITVTRSPDGKDVVDNHLFKTEGDKEVEIWHQG